MLTQKNIETRINELKEKLKIIEDSLASEMKKPFYKRNIRLLKFLYKENAVYQFALTELENVVTN